MDKRWAIGYRVYTKGGSEYVYSEHILEKNATPCDFMIAQAKIKNKWKGREIIFGLPFQITIGA